MISSISFGDSQIWAASVSHCKRDSLFSSWSSKQLLEHGEIHRSINKKVVQWSLTNKKMNSSPFEDQTLNCVCIYIALQLLLLPVLQFYVNLKMRIHCRQLNAQQAVKKKKSKKKKAVQKVKEGEIKFSNQSELAKHHERVGFIGQDVPNHSRLHQKSRRGEERPATSEKTWTTSISSEQNYTRDLYPHKIIGWNASIHEGNTWGHLYK